MPNPSYQRIITIVHGKSEYVICNNIKSNLRLPQEIISNNKGRSSIQITGLMNILQDKRFKTLSSFKAAFPRVEIRKKILVDFNLYIIMDTDDCTEEQKKSFIDRSMFKDHCLYPYIVPIYNSPNLEQTMKEAHIEIIKKKDYVEIFPTNHGDADLPQIQELLNKLKLCRHSNMSSYIERCVELANQNIFT